MIFIDIDVNFYFLFIFLQIQINIVLFIITFNVDFGILSWYLGDFCSYCWYKLVLSVFIDFDVILVMDFCFLFFFL